MVDEVQDAPSASDPGEGLAVYDAPPPDVTFYWATEDQLDQLCDPKRDHNVEGKWAGLGVSLASAPTALYQFFAAWSDDPISLFPDLMHMFLFIGGSVAWLVYRNVAKKKGDTSGKLKQKILNQPKRRVGSVAR